MKSIESQSADVQLLDPVRELAQLQARQAEQKIKFQAEQAAALARVEELTAFTWTLRQALAASSITGANGAEIDHIELFSVAHDPANHSRNFVLCPGKAYDRSPCGTGTSAKLACLVADGKLQLGALWRQEGILGTVFTGSVALEGASLIPTITGSAYITSEAKLLFDPADPFRLGIPE